MTSDVERTARLHALKLVALVRDHVGREPAGEPTPAGPITALVDGDEVWALVHDGATRALGPALLWARSAGCSVVNVLTGDEAGTLARQAGLVAPDVRAWFVEGRALLPAGPTPRPEPLGPPPEHEVMRPVIEGAGADVVVEHGVLSGEVAGLEVCVVSTRSFDGEVVLEVGVGPADREAFALMYPDLSPGEGLTRVVAAVAPHRMPGAAPHPFNRLAGQRLLRHRVLAQPELVGAAELTEVPPPVPRRDVKDTAPCVAAGRDESGGDVVVVFSVGVDPDLVPFAAEALDAAAPSAALVLAVPERDARPVRSLWQGLFDGDLTVVGIPADR